MYIYTKMFLKIYLLFIIYYYKYKVVEFVNRSYHPIMRYVDDTNLIQIVAKFYLCHWNICHN